MMMRVRSTFPATTSATNHRNRFQLLFQILNLLLFVPHLHLHLLHRRLIRRHHLPHRNSGHHPLTTTTTAASQHSPPKPLSQNP
ncbi:hypothetical protein HanRHA438_Chr01g0016511 [Helianthus annuus]|nr:hypothetical protein HanRHA438_Chr01g0016511 [Helianthus annuus]